MDATTRRHFLSHGGLCLGSMALGMLAESCKKDHHLQSQPTNSSLPTPLAKAKRVVYLFQSGGPSQLDLYDYKPTLRQLHGTELPDSVRQGQRLTGMSGNQSTLPLAGSAFQFKQHGNSGRWVSELMPHTAQVVDDLCFIHSMQTEAINHDPAITFFQTGSMLPGRPSMGAWVSYGLGSLNENLPGFIVLVTKNGQGQPLYARLWGNGFLPTAHQGVQFRAAKDPVLYLRDPEGFDRHDRERMIRTIEGLNQEQHRLFGDPESLERIRQYEMAFRMQVSVPEAISTAGEPDYIYDLYGPGSREPGTYAANCLLARKLLERDVRFVQLYHQDWDHHLNLPRGLAHQCSLTDQATAALISDLKQRGLFEDTLVIWGGEFGRTAYSQGKLTPEDYGRDHHPKCFTMWLAGAGIRAGHAYGITDDFGYNVVAEPVHVHDLQATILHLLGIDHELLTYKYQGRRFRLTDVHGHIVDHILT